MDILREVGIRHWGHTRLTAAAALVATSPQLAELVGPSGQIYALDMNPAPVEAVRRIAVRHRLGNMKVILSDCSTGLPDDSLDVVLLYNTFHGLARPADVLITPTSTGSGMFMLAKNGERTRGFVKASAPAS